MQPWWCRSESRYQVPLTSQLVRLDDLVEVAQVAPPVFDHHRGAGDVVGQPGTVCGRDQDILCAVPHFDRNGDFGDVEAPRPQERELVIDPAPRAAAQQVVGRLANHLRDLRAGQLLPIRLGQVPFIAENLRRVLGHPRTHLGQLSLQLG